MKETRKNNRNLKNKTRKDKTENARSTRSTRSADKVYSKDDYNSGDGMLVTVWGPSLWHSLHTMSFNYPINPTLEEKKHYRNFILSLRNVLPCKYCRINLKENFKQLPLTMSHMKTRDTFSRYVYDLHELINKMLKKRSGLKFCDVRERYEHFRARCTNENSKLFKFPKNKTKKLSEKGCTEPLYGKKSKCIIKIVPQDETGETFQMDEKCIKKRG